MQRLRLWLAFLVFAHALMSFSARAALHLPIFNVGTNTYTNVVITRSTGGRVLLDYGRGMTTVRVTNLDLTVQQQLMDAGLVHPLLAKEIEKEIAKRDAALKKAERLQNGAPQALNLENAETTPVAQLVFGQAQQRAAEHRIRFDREWLLGRFGRGLLASVAAALAAAWVVRRFLLYRLCRNATGKGSLLVFVPFLRWIPLADAAGIARAWLLVPIAATVAMFFPPPLLEKFPWAATAYLVFQGALWLVTLLLYVTGCFRVCRKVECSAGWGLFLLLPVLDFIALFVLAFSDGKADASAVGAFGSLKKPVLAI
jgi:hypothetical protein